jgi:hypothetical protein
MKGRADNLRPWKPGESGNPGGRPKKMPLSDAYRELMEEPFPGDLNSKTWAQVIALAVATKAASGDPKAAAHIADRLEGKAPQAIQVSGSDGQEAATTITIQFVESDGNGGFRYVDRDGRPLSDCKENRAANLLENE